MQPPLGDQNIFAFPADSSSLGRLDNNICIRILFCEPVKDISTRRYNFEDRGSLSLTDNYT